MSTTITSTETHPHCAEILGVLAHTVHLDDIDVTRLALAWKDTLDVARARDHALRPETPLILEVLAAFDSVAALFADDLEGTADFVNVPAPVTALALKAVRDAIAAAYARPVLSAQEYSDLSRAWHTVFPTHTRVVPDFGPQHEDVIGLLSRVPQLACHSHDVTAARLWEGVLGHVPTLDRNRHAEAMDDAWHAAVLSGRRRLWGLLSRSAQEGYGRRCPDCARETNEDDIAVLTLCLGAAAGVLVRDLLDDASYQTLVAPVHGLLALAR